MARVTVEDCVLKVPNRFELVLLAAQRARDIGAGASLTMERDNDKNPVVALREIADDTISLNELNDNLITGMQRLAKTGEPESEELEILAAEAELGKLDTASDEVVEPVDSTMEKAIMETGSFEVSEQP